MYCRTICLGAAIALALVSCRKEENAYEVDASFCAVIQPGIDTRDGEDAGQIIADRAILEIWRDDVRENRIEMPVEQGNTNISFGNVKLAGGQDYDVFIWVDSEGYYNAENLRCVSLADGKPYDGKSLQFDAFCAYEPIHCCQGVEEHPIFLRRPLAQVNFIAAEATSARISFSSPTALDLKTGAVSGLRDFEYSISSPDGIAAFDYVFAGEQVEMMSYSFQIGDGEAKAIDVPVAKNTKTNIVYNNQDQPMH